MSRLGLALWLALSASWLAMVSSAHAQPEGVESPERLEAQAQFQRGLSLSAQENWVDARAAFLRSIALVPRPSSYFNLALVCLELGLGGAALDALGSFEALSRPEVEAAREKAAPLRERAKRLVGTLLLSVAPADARVELDGKARPSSQSEHVLLLDPGVHIVRVTAAGYSSVQLEVDVAAEVALHRRVELSRPAAALAPADVARSLEHAAQAPRQVASTAALPHRERKLWQKPWLWVTVAAVAAVAAGVTVAVIKLRPEDDPACTDCVELKPGSR